MEEDDNDIDSLFEGMDFVMPGSPVGAESGHFRELSGDGMPPDLVPPAVSALNSDQVNQLPAQVLLHSEAPASDASASQTSPNASSSQGALIRTPSEPLDENLFSGLSLSVTDNVTEDVSLSSCALSGTVDNVTVPASNVLWDHPSFNSRGDKPHVEKEGVRFQNIMAAYGDLPATQPAVSSAPTHAVRPATIKRKKRSLKIGYGREAEENEDEAHTKVPDKSKSVLTSDSSASGHGLNTHSRENPVLTPQIQYDSIDETSQEKAVEVMRGLGRGTELQSKSTEHVTVYGSADAAVDLPQQEKLEKLAAISSANSEDQLEAVETEAQTENDVGNEVSSSDIVKNIVAHSETEAEVDLPVNGEGGDTEDIVAGDPRTLEGRLENLKRAISEKLKALDGRRTAAFSRRKDAVQNKRFIAGEVSALIARLKELESELQSACEKEDFESADILSESAKEAENALDNASEAFRLAEAACDAAAEGLQSVLDLQMKIQVEGIHLLDSLTQDAQEESQKLREAVEQTAAKDTARLIAEEKALEMKKNKAILEQKVTAEAMTELDRAVIDSSAEDVKHKAILKDRRKQLNEELENLRLMVKAKEAEIEDLDQDISQIDETISTIAAKFEVQRQYLKMEAEAVSVILYELQTESEQLDAERRQVEDLRLTVQGRASVLLDIASAAALESTAMQQAVELRAAAARISLLCRKKKVELAEKELYASEKCKALRENASAARGALQELSCLKEKLQQGFAAAKQQVAFAEKRGPELESEKRLAASSRNFKEAARLAAEAKTLINERITATGAMNKIATELQKVEEEAEARVSAVSDLETALSATEREAAMARCERLRLIAAAARDESKSVLELEDSAEAESLDAEAEASDIEADQLKRMYNLEGDQFEKLSSLPLKGSSLDSEGMVKDIGDVTVNSLATAEGTLAVSVVGDPGYPELTESEGSKRNRKQYFRLHRSDLKVGGPFGLSSSQIASSERYSKKRWTFLLEESLFLISVITYRAV